MFEKVTLDEAAARAKASDKYLLIDFTAEWCGPCGKMDRTTWGDTAVHAWVRKHAVAVQLDADQHEALCREWDVKTLPSVIIRRGDAELDRVRGYQSSAQLLSWLEGVRAGRTHVDSLRAAATDVRGRFALGKECFQRGDYATALEQFAWLWEHALAEAPAWVGVRGSYLIAQVAELARLYSPALERFEQLRSQATFSDWVVLSQALGHEEEIVRRITAMTPGELEEASVISNHRVIELLVRHEDLQLLGNLLHHPAEMLRREREHLSYVLSRPSIVSMPAEVQDSTRADFGESIAKQKAVFIRALEAAGREADAEDVRAVDVELVASTER